MIWPRNDMSSCSSLGYFHSGLHIGNQSNVVPLCEPWPFLNMLRAWHKLAWFMFYSICNYTMDVDPFLWFAHFRLGFYLARDMSIVKSFLLKSFISCVPIRMLCTRSRTQAIIKINSETNWIGYANYPPKKHMEPPNPLNWSTTYFRR